jgi:hypothetical protein
MVNFEPPLPKSLPEAELFRILSEIPADSEGMQRAAELVADHERLLAEDALALESWVRELEADGSPQALAALAKHRGLPDPAATEINEPTPQPLAPISSAVAPTGPEPTVPEPPRASFESLLTGSSPVVVEASVSADDHRIAQAAKPRIFEYLYIPTALTIGLSAAGLSGAQALLVASAIAGGALLALLAARGGVRFAGQLGNITFGVTLGRIVFAVIAVISIGLLAGEAGTAAADLFAIEANWLIFAGLFFVSIGAAAIPSPWVPRVLTALPVGLMAWFAVDSSFAVIEFSPLTISDAGLVAVALVTGFITQSLALPLAGNSRYRFTAALVALATLGAVLGASLALPAESRALAMTVGALLLAYGVARESASSARRAKIGSAFALIPLALLGVFLISPFYFLSLDAWLIMAACALIGVLVSDSLLRSAALHEPSSEQSYGFYGAFSFSALAAWALAVATAVVALGLSGELDLGFRPILEALWLTVNSAALVSLIFAVVFGVMRFSVIRARELDQRSASGDTKLESLLGL